MIPNACGVMVISSSIIAITCERRVRRLRATPFRTYPNSSAANLTRSRVSGLMRLPGTAFSTCETVVTETPARAATSAIEMLRPGLLITRICPID